MHAVESATQSRRTLLHYGAMLALFIGCIISERSIIAEIQGTYYLNRARELSADPNHYEQFVENALSANPMSGLAHFERSRILASHKQYEPALDEALLSRTTFSSPRLYKHLANLYLKGGDTFTGREFFEKSARVIPSEPDSVEALASIYFKEKRFDDARALLTRALALYPRDANLAYWLALTEQELGNASEALAAFQQAVQNRERAARRATFSLGDAYFNQAHLLAYSLNAPREAIKYLQLAIDTERKPHYYYLMIRLYEGLGEKDHARAAHQQALKMFPNDQTLRDWKPAEK